MKDRHELHLARPTASPPRRADDLAGQHAVLLVSPHYDDAALSAGAFADLGRPIDVVTVFTGASGKGVVSHWDRRCGFHSEAAALAARDLEDRNAFAPGGHRVLRVGLVESGYAGRGPRPAAEAERLRTWFDDWHAHCGDAAPLVLLPVGAGRAAAPAGASIPRQAAAIARRGASSLARRLGLIGGRSVGPAQHPDHLWVRDALAAHVAARGARLGFYEEQPYLRGRRGDVAAADLGQDVRLALETVELPVAVASKARRIAAYASQIEALRRADPDIARPAGIERYWFASRPGGSR